LKGKGAKAQSKARSIYHRVHGERQEIEKARSKSKEKSIHRRRRGHREKQDMAKRKSKSIHVAVFLLLPQWGRRQG